VSASAALVDQEYSMASKQLLQLKDHLAGFEATTTFVALGIAARAALRGIPLLDQLWTGPSRKTEVRRTTRGREPMSDSDIVLGTFRSAATASVAARWHSFGKSDVFQEIQGHARLAGGTPSGPPTAAGGKAMEVAEQTFSRLPERLPSLAGGRKVYSAHLAAQAVAIVSLGFLAAYDRQAVEQIQRSKDPNRLTNRNLAYAEQTAWSATWEDVRLLEDGIDVQSLMTQPLWVMPAPEQAGDAWRNLSTRLLHGVDENWKCWTDWYEAMLAGPAGLLEGSETARVSLPNDLWEQGPTAANARITKLCMPTSVP
jgi:hypothetical protein